MHAHLLMVAAGGMHPRGALADAAVEAFPSGEAIGGVTAGLPVALRAFPRSALYRAGGDEAGAAASAAQAGGEPLVLLSDMQGPTLNPLTSLRAVAALFCDVLLYKTSQARPHFPTLLAELAVMTELALGAFSEPRHGMFGALVVVVTDGHLNDDSARLLQLPYRRRAGRRWRRRADPQPTARVATLLSRGATCGVASGPASEPRPVRAARARASAGWPGAGAARLHPCTRPPAARGRC